MGCKLVCAIVLLPMLKRQVVAAVSGIVKAVDCCVDQEVPEDAVVCYY